MTWRETSDNEYFPLQEVYQWLIIDFFIYFAIAIYLDNVFACTR